MKNIKIGKTCPYGPAGNFAITGSEECKHCEHFALYNDYIGSTILCDFER